METEHTDVGRFTPSPVCLRQSGTQPRRSGLDAVPTSTPTDNALSGSKPVDEVCVFHGTELPVTAGTIKAMASIVLGYCGNTWSGDVSYLAMGLGEDIAKKSGVRKEDFQRVCAGVKAAQARMRSANPVSSMMP